jgi:hypothetical protein
MAFLIYSDEDGLYNMSKRWIVNKYWHNVGNRNLVLAEGNKELKLLSDTIIVRHTKLKIGMK